MNLGWLFAWAKDNNITEPRDGSGRINVRKLIDMYDDWRKSHSREEKTARDEDKHDNRGGGDNKTATKRGIEPRDKRGTRVSIDPAKTYLINHERTDKRSAYFSVVGEKPEYISDRYSYLTAEQCREQLRRIAIDMRKGGYRMRVINGTRPENAVVEFVKR